jgi:hypothetical protein
VDPAGASTLTGTPHDRKTPCFDPDALFVFSASIPADRTAFCDFEIRRETVLGFDAVLEFALQPASKNATPTMGRKCSGFVLTTSLYRHGIPIKSEINDFIERS